MRLGIPLILAALVACSDRHQQALPSVGNWAVLPEKKGVGGDFSAYVWTGRAMFVWSGFSDDCLYCATGGLFDPSTSSWRPISMTGAPSPRDRMFASMADGKIFVWGGRSPRCGTVTTTTYLLGCPDGALYDPAMDSWTALPDIPAGVLGRNFGSAVWTGSVVVVWGGMFQESTTGKDVYLNDGLRFDPISASWSPVSTKKAPSARARHSAVWTGNEMIVWGGEDGQRLLGDGAAYDPATDVWVPISSVSAPAPREDHAATWTGREMIVLAGNGQADGGRYDPRTDIWIPIMIPAPSGFTARRFAPWTGSRLLTWGMISAEQGWGGVYDPETDIWAGMSTTPDAFRVRVPATLIWTGDKMVLWGGQVHGDISTDLHDGAAFTF